MTNYLHNIEIMFHQAPNIEIITKKHFLYISSISGLKSQTVSY